MTAPVQQHGADDEIQAFYRDKLEASRLLLRELSTRLDAGESGVRAAVDEVGDYLLRSAREREWIADLVARHQAEELREWKRRALVAEARLERGQERLLSMFSLTHREYEEIDEGLPRGGKQ